MFSEQGGGLRIAKMWIHNSYLKAERRRLGII